MDTIPRKQFLERLDGDWQDYVARFHRLDPQEQRAFLDRQGYATFGALLSHVIAWWQDGVQNIYTLRGNPGTPLPEYDVDAFNARAVQKFSAMSEAEIEQLFETQRQAMARLVSGLPDADVYSQNINTRLYYEILMHWTEHELSDPGPVGGG